MHHAHDKLATAVSRAAAELQPHEHFDRSHMLELGRSQEMAFGSIIVHVHDVIAKMQCSAQVGCMPAGMMASAPGLPLWMDLIQVMSERRNWTDGVLWHNNPIYQTGPLVLGHAMERHAVPQYRLSMVRPSPPCMNWCFHAAAGHKLLIEHVQSIQSNDGRVSRGPPPQDDHMKQHFWYFHV